MRFICAGFLRRWDLEVFVVRSICIELSPGVLNLLCPLFVLDMTAAVEIGPRVAMQHVRNAALPERGGLC